jgi:hypothetical protein
MEGTSRKGNSVLIWSITACEGYLQRLTTSSNGRYLKERQLGFYMEHYCSRRLSPTLDDFHPIEYKDKPHEPIPRLPFFDKVAGCMSSLIDAAALLIEHNRWETNLQKIVEITTATHWLGTWLH